MLPKIEYPVFFLSMPFSKKEVRFRPYTVKEEKILLTAQESRDNVSLIDTMMLILNNCMVDQIDLQRISFIEMQYLFLQLRAKSVGSIATLLITDDVDPKRKHKVNINLEDVTIHGKDVSHKLVLNDNTQILMQLPNIKAIKEVHRNKPGIDQTLAYMRGCIHTIYINGEAYVGENLSDEELEKFINDLPPATFEILKTYVNDSPKLTYRMAYLNSQNEERAFVLDTLENFS